MGVVPAWRAEPRAHHRYRVPARFRADLVRAVEGLGNAEALATLRALSVVGVEAERERARAQRTGWLLKPSRSRRGRPG